MAAVRMSWTVNGAFPFATAVRDNQSATAKMDPKLSEGCPHWRKEENKKQKRRGLSKKIKSKEEKKIAPNLLRKGARNRETHLGSQPGVVEVQPTDKGSIVEGSTDRVKLVVSSWNLKEAAEDGEEIEKEEIRI